MDNAGKLDPGWDQNCATFKTCIAVLPFESLVQFQLNESKSRPLI